MGRTHLLPGRIRHTAQSHLPAVAVGLDTNRQAGRLGVARQDQEVLAAVVRQVVQQAVLEIHPLQLLRQILTLHKVNQAARRQTHLFRITAVVEVVAQMLLLAQDQTEQDQRAVMVEPVRR
jgi:hypothetical protein